MNGFARSVFGVMVAAGMIANAAFAYADEPLRFSVSANWAQPFAEFSEDGALKGGLMLEIIAAIGREVGLPWRISVLPRQRLDAAAEAKEFDVRCYVRPEWTRSPAIYFWSAPIFQTRDVVIARRGEITGGGLEILSGRSVSTVLGYRYPEAEAVLQRPDVTRHVAPSERNVAMMVAIGRSDLGIVSDIVLDYLKRVEPALKQIEILHAPGEPRAILCGVLRDINDARAQRVLSAIAALSARGDFQRITAPTQ